MVALHPEDIHGGRGDESTGGQGDADQQVETDPDAPGIVVGQVGDCIQTWVKRRMVRIPPTSKMTPATILNGEKVGLPMVAALSDIKDSS
jgi:hypothetical protein